MTKLGLHLNTIQATSRVFVERGKPVVIKVMQHDPGWVAAMRALSPRSFWIGRWYVPDSEQGLDNPAGRARALAARIIPMADQCRYDCWEQQNEVNPGSVEDAKRLNEFAVVFADAMHRAGHKVAAYSFATGNPAQLDLWSYLLDGLRASDLLSLHEYAAPSMRDGESWLCLRYRRVYASLPPDCRKPLVITECGIDGGPIGKTMQGWQELSDADRYLADLAWYDAEISKDGYVVGATPYCMGATGMWRSFEILNTPLESRYLDYLSSRPAAYWSPPPVITKPKEVPVGYFTFNPDYPGARVLGAATENANGIFREKPYIVVLHGTVGLRPGMGISRAPEWFRTPPAKRGGNIGPSSAHFVVGANGAVVQCVPLSHVAWHAGASRWGGRQISRSINPFSIGIEIDTFYPDGRNACDGWNMNHPQMVAVEALVRWLIARYQVQPGNLVTHKLISTAGKYDPGSPADPFPIEAFRSRIFNAPPGSGANPNPQPAPPAGPTNPAGTAPRRPKLYDREEKYGK